MISFRDICKSFGKNKVLEGVNIDFDGNQIIAVLGPNGSGKTTLMKALLGMVLPDKGEIVLDGVSIKGQSEYRKNIGYLPQIARFPENIKVQELIHMISDIRSHKKIDTELIEYFELQPFMDKRLGHLSGGTRQKVNIVLAFMFDSPILVLDEPTVGLDPVALIKLKDLILLEKEKGKTILITSHIMSFVEEMADDLVFLLEGKIHFRGNPAKIKKEYLAPSLERAIANLLQGLPKLGTANGHPIEGIKVTVSKSE